MSVSNNTQLASALAAQVLPQSQAQADTFRPEEVVRPMFVDKVYLSFVQYPKARVWQVWTAPEDDPASPTSTVYRSKNGEKMIRLAESIATRNIYEIELMGEYEIPPKPVKLTKGQLDLFKQMNSASVAAQNEETYQM